MPQLRKALDDVDSSIDNQSVAQKHDRYVRSGGKKSFLQQMKEQRVKELREEVKDALGQPGMRPNRDTVKLAALASDIDVFIAYLTGIRKADGGLLGSGAYCALRSSYIYLFRRYRFTISREFEDNLKEAMKGVKRITTIASQFGEENFLRVGNKPLTLALYQQFNKWFLADRDNHGFTPLNIALNNGAKDIAKYLIKANSDCLSRSDLEGNSLLHHACLSGHSDVVNLILRISSHGASVQNVQGKLPIQLLLYDADCNRDGIEYVSAVHNLLLAYPDVRCIAMI